MSLMEWSVVAGAVVTIAWVNWYFFVAGRAPALAAVAVTDGGTGAAIAEVVIMVDGGYSPNTVRVKVGAPVRLVFDRKDDSSCSEEVVIPAFGVRKYLPTGARTTIEVTAPAAGTYPFMCGMSMLRGTIIADA
ncbi:MAG: cupredoxin domain-containing protein [Gemmatimonadota bacterium]|nr:cupredoxin domain-containing protein [Gemmatimonadota bacterium]